MFLRISAIIYFMEISQITQAKTFEELKEISLSLQIENQKQNQIIEASQKMMLEKDHENQALQKQNQLLLEQLKLSLHRQYGKKSESVGEEQLSLFDEPKVSEEEKPALEKADEEIHVSAHVRQKSGRKPLPKDLPTEDIIHDLKEDEKVCRCGCALKEFGEDLSEQLKYVPAKFTKVVHHRKKYACPNCQIGVKMAELPKQPIPKSIATPSLLAQVIISKYQDHLPLYRQEQIFNRLGIDLPTNTFSLWMIKRANLLAPLVQLIQTKIQKSHYVHADETPVRVLTAQGETKTSQSYMFVYATDKLVFYDYQPTRAGESAETFLGNFKGYLQTDAFSGYNRFENNSDITLMGCWAHARRKFFEITKLTKNIGSAHEALKIIQSLYQIETQIKENPLDERQKIRQEKSKPILDKFKDWLEKRLLQTSPKSALGSAMSYTLSNWIRLTRYLEKGELAIDNNLAENKIRPFAIGRKNWLFCQNEKGAQASAILYSLIETAKAHSVEPSYYLHYILEKMPDCQTSADIEKLLPDQMANQHVIK